jgi:hypothetical protein
MPRIRTIKPDFFTDEDVAELAPLVRLLFIAMWTLADKAGRLKDKPSTIKARCLPFDKLDVDDALLQLEGGRFIQRYEVESIPYIQIRTWNDHQRPHHTEKPSVIPPCDNGYLTVRQPSVTAHDPCAHIGMEKGKERNGEGERKGRAVARFVPPSVEEVAAYIKQAGLQIDPQAFVDFYSSKGWQVGKSAMKDWHAAARNADRGGWCTANGSQKKTDPLAHLLKVTPDVDAK